MNNNASQENNLVLIKKGIKELINKKWKLVFVGIYLIIALILWSNRHIPFDIFPFHNLPTLVYGIIEKCYSSIIAIFLILCLLQLVILIGRLCKTSIKPTKLSIYDTVKECNLLCVGNTGSGKSYAMLVRIGALLYTYPNLELIIGDFKKSSFAKFEGTPNFYGYTEVPKAIHRVYQEFTERLQANDEQRNKNVLALVLDEYGALITSLEKREAEEIKSMIAEMLFMSRSLGIYICTGLQRADAEYFKSGAREQYREILAMGNLSKEQKNMLFYEYKEQMTDNNKIGEGYVLLEGQNIQRVKVEKIQNIDALNERIKKAMSK